MAARGKRNARVGLVVAAFVAIAISAPGRASAQGVIVRTSAVRPDLGQPQDPMVEAALALVDSTLPSIPRIYLVDPARMHLKTTAAAFRVWYGDRVNPNVFVNQRSSLYQETRAGSSCALKSLAAVLVHEAAHSQGKGEAEPCRLEISVLDTFIKDPLIGSRELVCLLERRKAVQLYGGLQN